MTIDFTLHQKVIGAFAVVAVALAVFVCDTFVWSRKVARLEKQAAEAAAKAAASDEDARAAIRKADAAASRAGFLDEQLRGIRELARKQDEQLQKLNIETRDARSGAERARGIRSIATTAAELCAKLKDLGHGCAE